MTKILISIDRFPPDFTGSGLRAFRFSKRMRNKYGCIFNILTFENSKDKQTNNLKNVKRLKIITPKLIFPIFILELIIKINIYLFKNRKKIEIIHLYSLYWLNRIVMLSNVIFYKKKTILEVTLDGSDDPISMIRNNVIGRIFKFLIVFLFNKCDKIIVQTKNSLNSCLSIGIKKENIWLRPNPIDEKIFASISFSNKESFKKKLKVSNKFILLNIGSISERKNQLFLVKCIHMLKNKKIQLILIGPKNEGSSYYNSIKEYIKNNNLSNSVSILGKKNNIDEFMLISDLFVYASKNEGFCNVLGESMMSGLPIVTSYLDGISGYIEKGNGILINIEKNEERNIYRFISSITKVYNKKRLYNRQKIREMGIKYFSDEKIDKKYRNIYLKLLKNKV